MSSTTDKQLRYRDTRLDRFPVLASLRITIDDLEELSHQGFLCRERRGKRIYFKLRFRSGGTQVVRYIRGAERAAAVYKELVILRRDFNQRRKLKTVTKRANKALREAKAFMEPLLKANGYVFHGLAVRRPRTRKAV